MGIMRHLSFRFTVIVLALIIPILSIKCTEPTLKSQLLLQTQPRVADFRIKRF